MNKFLNQTTMYRLVLYFLIVLNLVTIFASSLGILPYKPLDILLSTLILVVSSWLVNKALAKYLSVYTNPESSLITALILALIVGPFNPIANIAFLVTLAAVAITSKYILAVKKRHIFNPAAVAVVISIVVLGQGASWWIGNVFMLAFVALGGILILTKIKRFTMVLTFLATNLFLSAIFGVSPINTLLYSPLVFFATVMLVEPLTSPVETQKQIIYAGFVAILLVLYQEFLKVPYTLELALITGNVFSYLVSSPFRLNLTLIKKEIIARESYSFYFKPDKSFSFKAGQFMYWTLPHKAPDSKGVRRFFTISSSPTQREVIISVKISKEGSSSFKNALLNLKKGNQIVGMDASGEFVLPKDRLVPLAFIAGGIGITPFISMAKWMIDAGEERDIILLYSNRRKSDAAFKNVLEAAEKFGLKTHYVITKRDGYIDEKMIKTKVPDCKDRIFYVSGPQPMVQIFEKMLAKMGVRAIKTDFFPGYIERHQE